MSIERDKLWVILHFYHIVNTFIGAEKELLEQSLTFYFCPNTFFFSVEKNDGLHIRFCSMNTVFTSFHTPRRFCAASTTTTTAATTTVTTMTATTAAAMTMTATTAAATTTTTTMMTPTATTATPTAAVTMKHLP
jgi:hypothetical protein